MKICVTGGAGFIGSHLVDRLITLGHHVVVIDDLSTGCREFINKKAHFYEMDICDSKLGDIFSAECFDYVFHEAAQTMVPVSMENPKRDCQVNLIGLINILDACKNSTVKKFLMPSSAAVYGNATTLPLKEDIVGIPSSFYGLTKLTSESYLRLYKAAFGLPYICYRYANVYGPRQGNGGEGGVVSIFCQRLVNDQELMVYGDGEQTRDFIHVDDVVSANIAGIDMPAITGIFNVSTNKGVSVNQLIRYLEDIKGCAASVTYEKERIGDIKHSRLDTQKSKKILKWCAEKDIKEGLLETYNYFLSVNRFEK